MQILTAASVVGPGNGYNHVGGPLAIGVYGTFDTATVNIEAMMGDGTWVVIEGISWTAAGIKQVIDLPPMILRLNVASVGATTSLNGEVLTN